MANLDKTGPSGMGPLTGRGQGYCSGTVPQGRGTRPRRGLGRMRMYRGCPYCGYPQPAYPALTKEQERDLLKDEVAALEEELKQARAELEKTGKTK